MHSLIKSLLLIIFSTFLIGISNHSHADELEDLAHILNKLDDTGANPFKISGDDLLFSRELIECIENTSNDTDAAICISDYHETPIGQKLAEEAEIPYWFWDLLDAYIDVRTEDYWGLVENLGRAAICIVAQVIGNGTDVCGIISDIIEAAEDILEFGKDLVAFLESVGEEAVEVVENVGCSLGIGSCDDSSPPEDIVYAWIYAPTIHQGVYARESTLDSAFYDFKAKLKKDATSNPVIFYYPILNQHFSHSPFSEHVVDYVDEIYTRVVDAQWSSNIVDNTIPALLTKRNEYSREANFIATTNYAVSKINTYGATMKRGIIAKCDEQFKYQFKFSHYDRWLHTYPQQAKALPNLLSNFQWCSQSFWKSNIRHFAKYFEQSVSNNFCRKEGEHFECSSISKLESCVKVLESLGTKNKCRATANLSKVMAKKASDYLVSKGSKLSCEIDTNSRANPQAALECQRPAQQYHCNSFHQQHYSKLPNRLFRCTLDTSTRYDRLVKKAKKEADKINRQYGWKLRSNPIDPLGFIDGPEAGIAQLPHEMEQELTKNRGFPSPSKTKSFTLKQTVYTDKTKPVIPSIDGLDSPIIYFFWKDKVKRLKLLTQGLERRFNLPGTNPLERNTLNPFSDRINSEGLESLEMDTNGLQRLDRDRLLKLNKLNRDKN